LRVDETVTIWLEEQAVRRTQTLAALSWMGAKNDGMGNRCELLINVVMWNKTKMLIGLDQKVRGMVGVLDIHSQPVTAWIGKQFSGLKGCRLPTGALVRENLKNF
jgi:hypothetical protein